jgi:hypothetical protein
MAALFLSSALDGGEWSASCSGYLMAGEGTYSPHWIGGWVDLRAGLDMEAKRKMLAPSRNWTMVVQSIVSYYTDVAKKLMPLQWILFSFTIVCMEEYLADMQSPESNVQVLARSFVCMQACMVVSCFLNRSLIW